MIMDLTHQNLIFQINEAEGRAISSEEHFTKYEGSEDIATPREFIEIPNGGRNLLDRFNFEHISLNSNSKNSDSNFDFAIFMVLILFLYFLRILCLEGQKHFQQPKL